jgi:hypothetical protein
MKQQPAVSTETRSTGPSLTTWIMLAVLVWGSLLALGSYLFGGNHPALRAGIVLASTLAFLGLWWAALAVRSGRQ